MSRFARWMIAVGLLLIRTSAAADVDPEAPLAPADFAYGREVQLPADTLPLVRLELPLEIYRAMRSSDLSDLMVFNGRGAQVPHAIRTLQAGLAAQPQSLLLQLFPLPPADPDERVDLMLEVERDGEGKVVRIATRASGGAPPPAASATTAPAAPDAKAYVLDARALERPLIALSVKLAEAADNLVLPVRVAASDDLVSFSELAVRGSLIELGHAGHRISQDRLELEPTRAPFYRLSSADGASFPRVAEVRAILASEQVPRPLERMEVSGRAGKSQVFAFDLGGPVPVDRFEIALPEVNTVVGAELLSSTQPGGPFHLVARARLYRIAWLGQELAGPTLDVARRHDRYYQLRVDPTGGGLSGAAPRLVTFHALDQLLFLRKGEGPFTLAYGRYRVDKPRFEAEDLLMLLPTEQGAEATTALATLGEVKRLGGPERLTAPKPPPPYKMYALWAVLVAGVLLLGGLALQLARERVRPPQ